MNHKTLLGGLLSATLVLTSCGAASSSSSAEDVATPVTAETPQTQEKALTVSASSTPSSPEEATSVERGGSERWSYIVATYPSEISYQFQDVQVTVPAAWEGKYEIEQANDSVVFYHKASHEKWVADGMPAGGVLFSVNFSADTSYRDLPSYCDLGSTAEGYYYLEFPTDMQGYEKDATTASEYLSLSKDQMFIRNNSWVTTFA